MPYQEKESLTLFSILKNGIILLAGLLLGFGILRIFLVPFTVNDNSMKPNFIKGEKILILKHITPEIGDIVLIKSPVEPDRVLLKRIISKENDTIEIKNKIIYINNKKLEFTWRVNNPDKRIFPMTFTFRDNMPNIKLKRKEF